MSKIRILHVIGRMNRGGTETLLMNIYRNIDRDKYQFDFLVQTKEESHYDSEIKKLGGRILPIIHPRKNILKYRKMLRKILLENGPYDVVHSHIYNFSGIVLNVAKNQGVSIRISHSHNTQDGKGENIFRKTYKRYMKTLVLENSTDYLACSVDAGRALFGKGFLEKSNAKVLKNGIDLNNFETTLNGSIMNLREELCIDSKSKIVGHIGSFTNQKNHEKLIEIFAEVLQKDSNAHLVLVGEGPLKEKIIGFIKERNISNNVHLLGIRSDITELLVNFDVFLFPSLFEGLGLVLVEAQAVNLNCITSSTVPKEVDIGAGLLKFIDLNENLEVWANAVNKVLSNGKMPITVKSQEIKRSGYDIRSVVMDLERIYSSNPKHLKI